MSYESPFTGRYCSPEMSKIFSTDCRALLFRKLWIALAKAEKKHGLPITEKQIDQMVAAGKIDFDKVKEYEKKFRHDVMAHIHAFGDACPEAKPIIHLGATSSFVTDNADLILLRDALLLLFDKSLTVLKKLADLAEKHKADPCLSYTHFQPAQPTTIGKRICLWLQDLLLDAKEFKRLADEMPFLGVKGATGTQASFLALFDGNHKTVTELEKEIATEFGFTKILPIAGQTYTRKLDIHATNAIESFAASAHKLATDIRLLAHEGEFLEPFTEAQVGSSAMPYKRNPIYSERICGLARFAISLSQNSAYTVATQWLERSLDDSSNRRLTIPESFLSADAILNLLDYVLSKPQIQPEQALANLQKNIATMSMENALMASVKKGESRQDVHEKMRTGKQTATPSEPKALIGRAPEQVSEFLQSEVRPFLKTHPTHTAISPIEI